MTSRSFLYVPGNNPALFAKAEASRADAVILDLEDAVPFEEKDRARQTVVDWLAARAAGAGKPVWVRVNPGALGEMDLDAVASQPGLGGIVLAKAQDEDQTAAAVDLLRRRGSTVSVSPLIETPGGVFQARAIAAVDGVAFLQLGEYDLAAEVGLSPADDGSELLWARSQIVFASAAAGVAPPMAPVSVEIRNEAVFAASTRALARLGFVGRACIHPAQVDVVNAIFTPDAASVASARQSVDLFEAAIADGRGVVVDNDGRMVDEATIRSARAVLALAAASD